MKKSKKLKEIKAEKYEENKDLYAEVEDDIYEEDNEEIIFEEDTNNEYFEETEEKNTKLNKFMKIFNIIFILLMLAMILISFDVICVAKYDMGPFFAIKTKTYKDGGTKVYYGLGYKVIKYNIKEGRKGTKIGSWNMDYIAEPTQIEDIDLAIEFENNPEKTADKYYKQYLSITTKIKEINQNKNKLALEYTDEDGKYTLQINCKMADELGKLTNFEKEQKVVVKGTVYDFSLKEEDNPNSIYLSECFIEQIETSK